MIRVRDLTVDLAGRRVVAVPGLDIVRGRVLAVVGGNGSGKSTLLRALAGLQAHGGTVTCDGGTAWLPQRSQLDAPLTAAEVVMTARYAQLGPLRGASAEDHRLVAQALADCDATHLADRRIDALSGGERARVLIARALATGAPTLLLDEPGAHLDLAHRLRLHALLRRQALAGRAIVVALHDLHLVAGLADDLLVLHDGTVAGRALDDEVLAEAFALRLSANGFEALP